MASIKPTIQSITPKRAAMRNAASLLRDVPSLVRPEWKIRVSISRVRSTGQVELFQLLLRGAELAAALEGSQGDTPEPPIADEDWEPSPLQRRILAVLQGGVKTTGQLSHECDVTSGRLFDRGKGLHELMARGLAEKRQRGYGLTEAGRQWIREHEPTPPSP